MPQFVKHFVQDLTQDIKIRQCGTIVFNGDNLSNVITVDLFNGTEPYSGGGSVSCSVICPDGATVPITNGSISGNTVTVTLTGDCFVLPGQIGVGVQVVSGDIRTTVLKAIYNVELLETDTIVDPGSRITASVGQLVSDIEAATASVPPTYTDLLAAVAPTFSTSTAYTKGQYIWYNATLYRFTADHAVGTWTGSDVEAIPLTTAMANFQRDLVLVQSTQPASDDNRLWIKDPVTETEIPTYDEFSGLKSALVIPSGINLYNKETNIVGKNIASTGDNAGELVDNSNFDASDWIYCPKGKYIIRAFDISGSPNYTVYMYNASKEYYNRDVSAVSSYPNGAVLNFAVNRYVRIVVPTAGKTNKLNDLVFMAGESVENYIPYYTANDKTARKAVSELQRDISNLMLDMVENSSLSTSTGNFYYEDGTNRTTFIDCSGFTNLIYYTTVQSTANAFYDSSKNFISSFPTLAGKLNNNYRYAVVPDDAKYFVLSNTPAGLASTKIMPVSEIPGVQKMGVYSGLAYSSTANKITLETQGTDIVVTFPSQWYVDLPLIRGNVTSRTITNATSFTVPSNRYLVYNDSTSTVSVMAFADIQAVSAETPLVVLMYNDYGRAIGMLNPYQFTPDIPSYYDSYIATKTDTINAIKAETGTDGFSFVFITDEHVQQNRMQSPKLIKYIRENTSINTIINGGDIFTNYATKAEAYKGISNFVAVMGNTGSTMYSIIGNHEFNNPSGSSSEEALAIMLSLQEVSAFLYTGNNYSDCVFYADQMTYYKDFGNLRVFFLPCNYASGVYLNAVKWILNQFQNVPSGYSVMVAAHVLIDNMSTPTLNTRVLGLANGMDALKSKTTYTYEGTTYDYTSTNTTPVCIIGGHSHDDYDTTTTGGIPIILTTCDSNQQEQGGLTRTAYTTNEQAFDVVTINYSDRKINLTRIGAGEDREFDY